MRSYSVFGGRLDSEIEFPELSRAPEGREADWTLRRLPGDAPPWSPLDELLGTHDLGGGFSVSLYRSERGFELRFQDTGCFCLEPTGREIGWHAPAEFDANLVRADVLGTVLAAAMHLRGTLCLHGSCVELGAGAVAFLGPKGFGKSTLALALIRAGARLLTDDSLPVCTSERPSALPGVHHIRVWEEVRARIPAPAARVFEGAGGKQVMSGLPESALCAQSRPLCAIYLLNPSPGGEGQLAARREAVPALLAALRLVPNGKIGELLGKTEAAAVLERLCALAERVPVYTLSIPRDYARLEAAIDQLLRWHGGPPDRSRREVA